jgi:DNA-directed RNA polymerase subunit RPC12/RpoP
MPAGAPLRIIAAQQAGNPTQREYECPNCQNRFIVEDPRRPLAAKCPRCGAMMRLP